MAISPSETLYICQSCESNFRLDGRQSLHYRPYTIHAPKFSSQILSNGSSRIFLPGSKTELYCSIRAELIRPALLSHREGSIDLNIDLLPFASPLHDRKEIRKQEMEVSSILSHLLLPHVVDKSWLVILEERYAWRLNIDVMVVHIDGNLIDACSMVIHSALQNLRLPKVVPIMQADRTMKGQLSSSRQSSSTSSKVTDEIMFDSDITKAISPEGNPEDCPIIVTVYLIPKPSNEIQNDIDECNLNNKIENVANTTPRKINKKNLANTTTMIVDPSRQEELCASSRVSISIDGYGNICGIYKHANNDVVGLSSNASSSSSLCNISFTMLSKIQNLALKSSKAVYDLFRSHNNSNADKYALHNNSYENEMVGKFFAEQYELQ